MGKIVNCFTGGFEMKYAGRASVAYSTQGRNRNEITPEQRIKIATDVMRDMANQALQKQGINDINDLSANDKAGLIEMVTNTLEKRLKLIGANQYVGKIEAMLFNQKDANADGSSAADNTTGNITVGSVFVPDEDYTSNLEKWYGSELTAMNKMLDFFNMESFNALFVNNGRTVNPADISKNLMDMKVRLVENLLDYIDSEKFVMMQKTWNAEGIRRAISQYREGLKSGDPLKVNDAVKGLSIDLFAVYSLVGNSIAETGDYAEVGRLAISKDHMDEKRFKAFNSMFILQNFDKILETQCKGIFDIRPESGRFVEEREYKLKSENNLHKNWVDDDKEILAIDEAGSVTKRIINAIPLYRFGSNVPEPTKLGYTKFNYVVGSMKKIALSSYANSKINFEGYSGTLSKLVSNIGKDGGESFRILINYLCSSYSDANPMIPDPSRIIANILNINNKAHIQYLKDAVWSIKQFLYGDEGTQLYKSSFDNKRDTRMPNYYLYLVNYSNSLNRVDHYYYERKRYEMEKDSYFEHESMETIPMVQAKRAIISRIYNASPGIVSNLLADMKESHDSKSIKNLEPRFDHNFENQDKKQPKMVAMKDFVFGGKVYSIYWNTLKNPFNNDAFTIFEQSNDTFDKGNRKVISSISVEQFVYENINKDWSTNLDGFFDTVFGSKIQEDERYRRAFYDLGSERAQKNIEETFKTAVMVSMLSYLNRDYLPSRVKSMEDLEEFKRMFYSGLNLLSIKGSKQLNNIPNTYETRQMQNRLVEASMVSDEAIGRDTVKTTDGKQLGTSQLNRLSTNPAPMMEKLRGEGSIQSGINPMLMDTRDITSEIKRMLGINFGNLVDGGPMFEGNTMEREIKTANGETKSMRNVNVGEIFSAKFAIDFLNVIYLDGVSKPVSFFTQVNADKSSITNALVNGEFIKKLAGLEGDQIRKIFDYFNKKFYNKLFARIDTDVNEIRAFINDISLQSPKKQSMLEELESKLTNSEMDSITKFVSNVELGSEPISVKDNFGSFNTTCHSSGLDPYKMVMLLCKAYNIVHDGDSKEPLNIIDTVHFVKKKMDFEGNSVTGISINPLLAAKAYRCGMADGGNIVFQNANNPVAIPLELIHEDPDSFFHTSAKFNSQKTVDMIFDMMNNRITVDQASVNGDDSGFEGLSRAFEKNEEWYNNGRMVIFKITGKDGKVSQIRSRSDLLSFMNENHLPASYLVNSDLFTKLISDLSRSGYKFEANKDLYRFNIIDAGISDLYKRMTIGDNISHPIKNYWDAKSDYELYQAADVAENKREVVQTASTHNVLQNELDGLPGEIGIAHIEDVNDHLNSFFGASQTVNPLDGLSFMAMDCVHLFNNSLGDNKVGIDMKPFSCDMDIKTGTGNIIKTSTDAITNRLCRKSQAYKNMAYKTMNHEWRDKDGGLVSANVFLLGFRGDEDYIPSNNGEYQHSDLAKRLIARYHPQVEISKGQYAEITEIRHLGGNRYERTMRVLDGNGEYNEESSEGIIKEEFTVNSNYALWQLFGGEWSGKFNPMTRRFEYGDDSTLMLVDMENMTGVDDYGLPISYDDHKKINSQKDVYQFMKHGNAMIVATHGAVKFGYTNPNDAESFFHDGKGTLNTLKLDLSYTGPQLDPTHKADNSSVSELTQVIASLASEGNSKEFAQEVYKALETVTLAKMEELLENLNSSFENPNHKDLAANLIIATMANRGSFEEEDKSKVKDLIKAYKDEGKTTTYDELKSRLNIADSAFLAKATPIIISYINTISIRKKMAGTLALMKGSFGLIRLYGGGLYDSLGVTDEEKFASLMRLEEQSPKFTDESDARMGHIYRVVVDNELGIPVTKYFNLKDYDFGYGAMQRYVDSLRANGSNYYIQEAFIREVDEKSDLSTINVGGKRYEALGRELAPIDYIADIQKDGVSYHVKLYDTDAVRFIFRLRAALAGETNDNPSQMVARCKEFLGTYGVDCSGWSDDPMTFGRRFFNWQTGELSKMANGGKGVVLATERLGQSGYLTGDSENSTVEIRDYECVSPNINLSKFGLTLEDDVNSVTPETFASRFIHRLDIGIPDTSYDFSMLKMSGNHINILDASLHRDAYNMAAISGMKDITSSVMKQEDVNGRLEYVARNKQGEVSYKLSAGDVVMSDGKNTLIVTRNPAYIISSIRFSGIKVSPNFFRDSSFKEQNAVDYIADVFNKASGEFDEEGKFIKGSGSKSMALMLQVEEGEELSDAAMAIMEAKYEAENGNDSEFVTSYQRELEGRILSEGIEPLKDSKIPFERKLYRFAKVKYEAFKKTQELFAARIPAQTKQSFMSMKNVAYENSGNNGCYVNNMQVWLQGSDYDGDMVTIQQYTIDDFGNMIFWSPINDPLDISGSFEISFPNGSTINPSDFLIINPETLNNRDKIDYYKYKKSLTLVINDIKDRIIEQNISTHKFNNLRFKNATIRDWVNIINFISTHGAIDVEEQSIYKGIDKNNFILNTRSYILKIITLAYNAHHTYFTDINKQKQDGIKNFITYKIIQIIRDPINLLEAQSAIDDMNNIETIANTNKNTIANEKHQAGLFTGKVSQYTDNMIGKAVIPIIALSVKNFFGITQYYNTIAINTKTDKEIASSLFDFFIGSSLNMGGIKIGNRRYMFITNLNPQTHIKKIIDDIVSGKLEVNSTYVDNAKILKDYLHDETNMQDGALLFSNLFTESTDNIKNQNLSKINATVMSTPFYAFGITIGMPMEEISEILMDPVTRTINNIMEGNAFYKNTMPKRVSELYNKYLKANKKVKLDYDRLPMDLKILVDNNAYNKKIDRFLTYLDNGFDLIDFSYASPKIVERPGEKETKKFVGEMIDSIRSFESEMMGILDDWKPYGGMEAIAKKKKCYFALNAWCNFAIDILHARIDINKNMYTVRRLIDMEKGVDNMRDLQKFMSTNKGAKTTQEETTVWRMNVAQMLMPMPTNVGDPETKRAAEIVNQFNEDFGSNNPYYAIDPVMNKPKTVYTGLDLGRFYNEDEYRHAAIEAYGAKCFAFNTLKILDESPSVRANTQIVNLATEIARNISNVQKGVGYLADAAIASMSGLDMQDRIQIARNAGALVNILLFDKYIRGYKFTLGKGLKAIKINKQYSNGDLFDVDSPIPFQLGTNGGNANFLKWMNETVVPNMQHGIYDERYPDKKSGTSDFIMKLSGMVSNRNLAGAQINVLGINVNSRSNNEIDMAIISNLKRSFRQLVKNNVVYIDQAGKKHNIANLMYMYNRIASNGINSTASLDEYVRDAPMQQDYKKWEDDTVNYPGWIKEYLVKKIDNSVLALLSPYKSTYASGMNPTFCKFFNQEKMRLEYYRINPNAKSKEYDEGVRHIEKKIYRSDYEEQVAEEEIEEYLLPEDLECYIYSPGDEFGYEDEGYVSYEGYNQSKYKLVDMANYDIPYFNAPVMSKDMMGDEDSQGATDLPVTVMDARDAADRRDIELSEGKYAEGKRQMFDLHFDGKIDENVAYINLLGAYTPIQSDWDDSARGIRVGSVIMPENNPVLNSKNIKDIEGRRYVIGGVIGDEKVTFLVRGDKAKVIYSGFKKKMPDGEFSPIDANYDGQVVDLSGKMDELNSFFRIFDLWKASLLIQAIVESQK